MALCLRVRDERELSNKLTIDKYIPISEIIVKFLKIEFARLQVLIPFPILKIQNDSSIIEQSKNLLIQHGLKYFQAKTMAECLFKTPAIKSIPIDDKKSLLIRMEQDILGHIIEEIVLIDLLKIKQSNKLDDIYICTLGLPSGEIDLALFNEKNHELALFEIKHSKTQNNNQARHLMNEKNISLINQSFKEYKIVRKTVLINNPHFEPFSSEDISWMDVSQFIREAEKNLFSAFIDPTTELNKDI